MPRFFALTVILCLLGPVGAVWADDDTQWNTAPNDMFRAKPNNPNPPERLEPVHKLPKLHREHVGTVRRVQIPQGKKYAALTFDLCELATSRNGCDMDILNFLRRENAPATLFMGGKWMRTHAERVAQIMERHDIFEIGNHAWSHGNFALLSPQGMHEQVMWTQAQYEVLNEKVGTSKKGEPVPTLFRLPYGRCTSASLQAIADMGLRVIQWDVVAESGADNRHPAVAQRNAKRVVKQVRPGSIILFHANLVPKGSAQLLREVVASLKAQGYAFVKVSDLLELGEPEICQEGYFEKPGDNIALDGKFGRDGTGLLKK